MNSKINYPPEDNDGKDSILDLPEDYMCDECHDTRYVTIGELDDIQEVPCPNCNEKSTIEEDMDDDS